MRISKRYIGLFLVLILFSAIVMQSSLTHAESAEIIEPGFAADVGDNIGAINAGTYAGLTATYDVTKTYRHMLMTQGVIPYIQLVEGEGNPGFDHSNLKVEYTQNGDMLELTFETSVYGPWGVDCVYMNLVPTESGKQGEPNSVVKGSLYFEKNISGVNYRSKPIPFIFTLTNQTGSFPTPTPTQAPEFQPDVVIEPGFAANVGDNIGAINAGTYAGLTATYDVTKTYRHMLMTHGVIEFIALAEGEGNPGFNHSNLKVEYTRNGDMLDLTFETLVYGGWGVNCLYINLVPTELGKQGVSNSIVEGSLYFEKNISGTNYRSKSIPFAFTLTKPEIIEPGFASNVGDNIGAINAGTYTGLTATYDVTKSYCHMLMTHGVIPYIQLVEGEGDPGFDHSNLKVEYTQNGDMLDLTFEMLNYGPWGVDCVYTNLVPAKSAKYGKPNSIVKGSLYFEKNINGTNYRSKSIPFIFTLTNQTAPIYITKSDENFTVGIKCWNSTHKYQIWTYQKTTSEIFGGEGLTNQWVLSHPYTLGSDRGANGFIVDGDAITRNIGPFNSVDSNYTVAVKVIDGEGNFVGQYKDTFTQAEAGEVVINKVTVDGVFADDKPFVKDIASGSPVQIVVTGNGVEGTEYTARLDQIGVDLPADEESPNIFYGDLSFLQSGNYSVTLTASTATSSDSRTINFRLYDSTVAPALYGEIGGAASAAEGAATETHFAIDIDAAGVTGKWFRYRISEPWAGTIRFSEQIDASVGAIDVTDNNSILLGKYGVYQVTGYTYRDGVASADDGFAKTVNYARPGGVELDVTVDGAPAEAITEKNKGDNIIILGLTNDTIPNPEYSFWRRDANGWVLIRDYGANSITWKPNRVGLYTIQVRAKEAGGLTYEVLKNIEFNITDGIGGDKIADDVNNITINLTNATARTPILLIANATSASQDLLYKFIISNGYIHYIETAYSADPTYMWVPGKAGDYTISVLVKNQASFGKYDAVETFTVTVQ